MSPSLDKLSARAIKCFSFKILQPNFMQLFSLKELGHLDYFLGLEIKYLPDKSILMTQRKYI